MKYACLESLKLSYFLPDSESVSRGLVHVGSESRSIFQIYSSEFSDVDSGNNLNLVFL